MKGVLRSAKNFTKGYSEIQAKLREATANEDWGPTVGQLEEISRATFNPTQLSDLIYIIDKRLNDHGKNWRHVYKTLIVLEFCICCGSDGVVAYAKDRLHEIKTLREFISRDEHQNDNGSCVREKSKDIVALLMDDDLLNEARRNKSPPVQRRPSSVGPLILPNAMGEKVPMITSLPSVRRSFDDLQNLTEEEAMALALQQSKAEYESLQDQTRMQDSKALLHNYSRSSSSSGSKSLNGRKNEGALSANQLLDLNDDEFEKILDSKYSSRSIDPNDIFNNSFNSLPSQSTSLPQMPQFSDNFALNYQVNNAADPFSNVIVDQDPFGNVLPTGTLQSTAAQKPPQIHPIAIPGSVMPELTVGAKPVIPGNMAPQFSHKPVFEEGTQFPPQQQLERNAPSSIEKDPFADIF